LVLKKTGAKHVHLIAHSMGNWPLVRVLQEMADSPPTRTTIDQIVLAAPDIDFDEFKQMAQKINSVARGVTLYASKNDRAMYAARKVHAGQRHAGDIYNGAPVIVAGIESIDISSLNTDWLSFNHSTYADSKELQNDIWLLMRDGKHPPDTRNNNFETKSAAGGKFWQYAE
jgi:esterase/lipase superfamily enzyme